MAFPSQFSLSLELTRVLPLYLATSKATEAIMNLARSLRNSGSDIVIEEDLAYVFGRCRLDRGFESSFKTVIKAENGSVPIAEGISLQSGPGPTVGRSFQHSAYFATVVQLSLLAWVHDNQSLGAGISMAMERRLEGRSAGQEYHPAPSSEGISSVIEACEEQTASYDWNKLLFAVGRSIDWEEEGTSTYEKIPLVILQGLLDMLPAVQAFPEERLLHIETGAAHCVLIVWIYHVLGLTTLIRMKNGREVRLGSGDERVLIETRDKHRPEEDKISLLDSKAGDVLLQLEGTHDDFTIDAASKTPALGYGRLTLLYACGHEAITDEMERIILSFSFRAAQHLIRMPVQKPVDISKERLIRAARFLFDNPKLAATDISPFTDLYPTSVRLAECEPSRTVSAFCRQGNHDVKEYWQTLTFCSSRLISLLLAFAQVSDLEACSRLPLREAVWLDIPSNPFVQDVRSWDGSKELRVYDDTWFRIISALLIEPNVYSEKDLEDVSLLSARGWSVYLSTFGLGDPALIGTGVITITAGVPVRNQVRKRGVIDGPNTGPTHDKASWIGSEHGPCTITAQSSSRVQILPMLCAERLKFFVVNVRLRHITTTGQHFIMRTGYRELHKCHFRAILVRACAHPPTIPANITVPPASIAIRGFTGIFPLFDSEGIRMLIFLTANDIAARWRAVAEFYHAGNGTYSVLIRADGCCSTCAMDQAALTTGRVVLIL